jgi:hypothetical protein
MFWVHRMLTNEGDVLAASVGSRRRASLAKGDHPSVDAAAPTTSNCARRHEVSVEIAKAVQHFDGR